MSWGIRGRVTSPRQGIPLRILRGQHVHQAPHHAGERSRLLEGVRAETAQRPRSDATEARRERALESRGVVRLAQRFEVADEEADHLITNGRPGSAHFIRNVEGAERLLERGPQCGRAAEEDREVVVAKVGKRCMDALDLSSAEERFVERVALVRDDHRRWRDAGD